MKHTARIFSVLLVLFVCMSANLIAGSTAVQKIKTDIGDFIIAPNSTKQITAITYSTNIDAAVQLTVYSMQGQLIKTLVDDKQKSGEYCVELKSESLAKGAYVVTLKAGLTQLSKKMIKN